MKNGVTLRSLKKTAEELVNTIKVAIYIRVSTHWQVDKESLPVQRRDLISYCKLILNTENYVIFEDPGYSAKNTDRPDFQKMMARVRTGEFTHILVWKIDRISRNLLDFAAMYQELKELGVTFVSKNEQFDTSTAIGEAMLKIILVFAELERHMTSERATAAMLSRATNGKWNGGKVPFGYRYDKDAQEFLIDEDEAKVVKLMYDLYDEQRSLLAVSKELNERGYRSRKGALWSPVTVGNLMRSPFYIGVMRYNYRDESGTTFSFKPESEWIMFEEHHPQIVTHEQWSRVVTTMQSQRRGQPGHGKTFNRGNVHIFAGLVTCGYCGSLMRATKDRVRSDGSRTSRSPPSVVNRVLAPLHVLATETVTTILPDAMRPLTTHTLEGGIGGPELPGLRVLPVGIRLSHLGAPAGHAGRRQAVHGVVNDRLLHIVANLHILVAEVLLGPDFLPFVHHHSSLPMMTWWALQMPRFSRGSSTTSWAVRPRASRASLVSPV